MWKIFKASVPFVVNFSSLWHNISVISVSSAYCTMMKYCSYQVCLAWQAKRTRFNPFLTWHKILVKTPVLERITLFDEGISQSCFVDLIVIQSFTNFLSCFSLWHRNIKLVKMLIASTCDSDTNPDNLKISQLSPCALTRL